MKSVVFKIIAGIALGCLAQLSQAAISCSVTASSVGVLYTASNVNTNGIVTLTCSRDPNNDANSITYRIKADDGANANTSAPFRRARLGASANYLNYILLRGGTSGGTASCGNSTNWRAPATGTTNVITGMLTFATGQAFASVNWGYCIRIRGVPGGNPAAPAAGIYTDSVSIFVQYPNSDAGAISPSATLGYTVGVNNQCVFNTFPSAMNFNYTAFGAAQVQTSNFNLRCSTGLGWAVSVSPASNVLLGLKYNITASPAAGTGTGNINQTITLTGTIPAGQAGTCATAICSATQAHVVTITY